MIEPKQTSLGKALPEFREWLESQTNYQRVGTPRRIMYCPVAMWMKEREGREDIAVEFRHIRRGSHQTRTPRWIRLFVQQIDKRVDPADVVVSRKIALEVLEDVQKQVRKEAGVKVDM